MSMTTDLVPWDVHRVWYEALLLDPDRFLYIGYRDGGGKLGMCRFDRDASVNQAEVSLALNPTYRNQGYSTPLLQASIALFRTISDASLIAKIKKNNIASIKCFERSGFFFVLSCGDYFIYGYDR